jgi:hypothetical protein
MQWSEMVAGAGLCLFFIIIVAIIAAVLWRSRKLDHQERQSMIEKGMAPPPRFSGGWPQVKQLELQARFEERRLMIEKGMVPPDLPPEGDRWHRDDFLRRGSIALFLGIGLGITYYLLPDNANNRTLLAWVSPGLALFGLGCLTYYWLSAKSARRSAEGAQR